MRKKMTPAEDYRQLLRRHLKKKKDLNPKYSQNFYATKINVSKGYLGDILAGKKHMSPEKLDLLCQHLELDRNENLQILISFLRLSLSQKNFSQMLKDIARTLNNYQDHIYSLEATSKKDLSILNDELKLGLFALMPYVPNGDLRKAHRSLRNKSYTYLNVKKAVELLVKDDLLIKESDGSYRRTQDYIRGDIAVGSHAPWFERSIEVIQHPQIYRPLRVQNLTFSYDNDNFNKLMELYTEFRNKAQELNNQNSKSSDSITVLHMQNLFYCLASINPTEE